MDQVFSPVYGCQETRELAAYAVIIIDIARSHGCFGWRRYDAVFWQQKAAGATLPWSEINASLMSNTVFAMLNGSQGLTCEFCFLSGHSKKDCALYCLEQYSMSSSSAATLPHRSHARGLGNAAVSKDTICLRFNKGTCTGICRYTHACSSCYTVGHAEPDCPKGKASSSYSQPVRGSSIRSSYTLTDSDCTFVVLLFCLSGLFRCVYFCLFSALITKLHWFMFSMHDPIATPIGTHMQISSHRINGLTAQKQIQIYWQPHRSGG